METFVEAKSSVQGGRRGGLKTPNYPFDAGTVDQK